MQSGVYQTGQVPPSSSLIEQAMFAFLTGPKRAREVASSLAQLVQMLSSGLESMGPGSPEKLLRGLGESVTDYTMGRTRGVRTILPVTPQEKFVVSLLIEPGLKQTIMVDGNPTYAGFTLYCSIPPKALMVALKPSAMYGITRDARLLHAACIKMSNVMDTSEAFNA